MGVKNVDGAFNVQVDGGKWTQVNATAQPHPDRFSLRCNIDGTCANFSAVISPEQVAIFNEVHIYQLYT